MAITPSQIETLATGAAKVTTDAGSVDQRSAADVIALDRYAAGKTAMAAAETGGNRLNRMLPKARAVPPGAV